MSPVALALVAAVVTFSATATTNTGGALGQEPCVGLVVMSPSAKRREKNAGRDDGNGWTKEGEQRAQRSGSVVHFQVVHVG